MTLTPPQSPAPPPTSEVAAMDSDAIRCLKSDALKSGGIMVVTRAVVFLIRTSVTIFLARILNPGDFGLVAMVLSFSGIIFLLQDFGLTTAAIQRVSLNDEDLSGLFWFNLIVALGMAAAFLASAPFLIWFYHRPDLGPVTAILSSVFLFSGLMVLPEAILKREMRFSLVAKAEVISTTLSSALVILLALYMRNYWPIVLNQVATPALNALVLWSSCSWRPSLPIHFRIGKGMLRFGGYLTGFNIINFFSRNADNMVVGRSLGAFSLGIYSRAYQLLLLPIQQITSPLTHVALRSMTLFRNDPITYEAFYLRTLNLMSFLVCPLVALMAAYADVLIQLFLGDKWASSVEVFRILSLVALLQPLTVTTGWLFMSMGKTNRMFKWGFVCAPIHVIGFVLGVRLGGINGVAWSYVVTYYLLLLPGLIYACRGTGVQWLRVFQTVCYPLLISMCIFGVTELGRAWGASSFQRVLATLLCGLGLVAILWVFSTAFRDQVNRLVRATLLLAGSKKATNWSF